MKRFIALAVAWTACSAPDRAPAVSSTLALSGDDRWLWVVNPDADSVSLIDTAARARVAEVALGPAPAVDPVSQRYEPRVLPRALALLPGDGKLYVAGQAANQVYVIDTAARRVTAQIPVGAEPTAVVAAAGAVYVVNHQSATVSRIDPHSDRVTATLPLGEQPWGAALTTDGVTLLVTQFLRGAGVTAIDTRSFTVRNTVALADQPTGDDKLIPSGLARGVYAAVPRPIGGDVWLPHLLLAISTAQPDLDFQSTVFPTISTLTPGATAEGSRLLFLPPTEPQASGAFSTVISGPRAIAFTPNGLLALVANTGSEDVLVLDGTRHVELGGVRPLPGGGMIEGIVVDHAGRRAWVNGRNGHSVTALALDDGDAIVPAVVDGAPIDLLAADPMPADLRLGQRLFYSANTAAYPLSQNFWVSCSSCHLEGGTDAVTWRFAAGPRDTPSNAGGPANTGFLMRQALRDSVVDYDQTIDTEQGGHFSRDSGAQRPLLDALAAYVNRAIPLPQNPHRAADGTLTAAQARGQATFADRCASCHDGPFYTDSAEGNPTLDLRGPVVLHDVGTCDTGTAYDDQPSIDVLGQPRQPCQFDTPTLRGIFATPPYFHDGSAATLRDVVDRLPFSADLADDERDDLVEYLQTL